MFLELRSLALAVLLVASPASAAGPGAGAAAGGTVTVMRFVEDGRIEKLGRPDQVRTLAVTVHVAGGASGEGPAVREDRGEVVSFLLRPDLERLYRLDHELKTYQEYRVPVRLEDHLPPGVRHLLRSVLGEEVLTREDRLGDDGGEGCRLAVEGTLGDDAWSVDARYCPAPRGDLPVVPYLALLRNVEALSPTARTGSARLADEERFPVRLRVELSDDDYRRTTDRRFLSVETARLSPARDQRLFEVPEDYTPAPPWCLSDFTVGSDPECRRISRLD